MSKLVIGATFMTRLEAELAKGYLESNGLKAVVTADDQGGMYPFPMSPTPLGAMVLVSEKDLKAAKELLKEIK